MKYFSPQFETGEYDYSSMENAKALTNGLKNDGIGLSKSIHNDNDLEGRVSAIAKAFGIDTQFNRDIARGEHSYNYMYMIRIPVPSGGPITPEAWNILDSISEKYCVSNTYTGKPVASLKVTTRQDIQLHWIKKKDLVECIREICSSGFFTLNGSGDNLRNTTACPLKLKSDPFNQVNMAWQISNYFRLPMNLYIEIFEIPLSKQETENRHNYPVNLMPRKFKIGIATAHIYNSRIEYDNCIDVRVNDIGIVPVFNDGFPKSLKFFQLYVGGGMGENMGKATFSTQALPLGTVKPENLTGALESLSSIFERYGDRKNRHWARFKYVVYAKGTQWIRQKLAESGIHVGESIHIKLERGQKHIGKIIDSGEINYGLFIENGRIIDGPNGTLKSMIREISNSWLSKDISFYLTPQQGIIIHGIPEKDIGFLESILRKHGYGYRNGRALSSLRKSSISCVGLPTCKMSYTDSERFEPILIDSLDQKYGSLSASIGISGCPAQCSMPATRSIGWIGTGRNRYMLKIGGTGNSIGMPLQDTSGDFYMQMVPGDRIADCTSTLLDFYLECREQEEDTGAFFKRMGNRAIIQRLKNDERTSGFMQPVRRPEMQEAYSVYRGVLNSVHEDSD